MCDTCNGHTVSLGAGGIELPVWTCPKCGEQAVYVGEPPRTCFACGHPSRNVCTACHGATDADGYCTAPGCTMEGKTPYMHRHDAGDTFDPRCPACAVESVRATRTSEAGGLGDLALAEAAVVRLLTDVVGEDPMREGLLDTPKRVVKALVEMTAGYQQDPNDILGTIFTESCDEMIVVTGITFTSLCEHHMLTFTGVAHVAYVPGVAHEEPTDDAGLKHRVVGLSKIARLVECYARRLQVQERMTRQIAHALMFHEKLRPRGVGVVVRSKHSCMGCRGIRKPGAEMVTSSLHGVMRDAAPRQEFMGLIG